MLFKGEKGADRTQLRECLPVVHGILGLIPSTTQISVAMHYNYHEWELKVQKFKVILGYEVGLRPACGAWDSTIFK